MLGVQQHSEATDQDLQVIVRPNVPTKNCTSTPFNKQHFSGKSTSSLLTHATDISTLSLNSSYILDTRCPILDRRRH